MITLDVISDPICPWCYIGKTQLDRALAARPDHPFDVFWRPYQLNPDMPREGMDRRAYLSAKFGGDEKAAEVYAAVEAAAAEAGLKIDFSKIDRTPNTLDAHRLIRWARVEEVQGKVVDELFRRNFEDGEDISDPAVLCAAAAAAEMDADLVATLLASDADLQEVRDEDAQAREIGVRRVPTFIVNEQYALQGAQPPEIWAKAIEELSGPAPAGTA
ncbi:DsbA family oxidoreductase [Rhodovulum sp. DZ06]|uniref:DsbA family oxidoreductase n=1 Tax=Rhodovulum sp. DZ06 TaxID=3425126 RepID=UPI003D33078D